MSPAGRPGSIRRKTPVFWWRLFFALAATAFSLLLILQPAPWRVLAEAGGMDNFVLNQTIYFWTWLAGVGSIVITLGLFCFCPWWAGAPAPDERLRARGESAPRWFWPLVLGAVAACAVTSGPMLNHSLWGDECESMGFYTLGRYFRGGETGRLRFKEFPWKRTVFAYSTPNNHIFHNLLSRSTNALWRAAARPRNLQFNHLAIRLPAFLSALLAVAAVALLLRLFGHPGAGVAAAWFLALHPWFTEHASVARGYTLLMLLIALAVIAWQQALRGGAWLWWAGFAAAQFLSLWTNPSSIFFFVPLNIAAALLIWRRPVGVAGPFRTQFSRWFCVNSMVAAALLPLLLPLLPQIREYIATQTRIPHALSAQWLHDVVWFFAGGAPWFRGVSETGWRYLDIHLVADSFGTAALWALGTVVVMPVAIGMVLIARSGWLGFSVTLCGLGAPCLQFLYAKVQHVFIWEWYVIFALPFVAIFWGLGAVGLAGRIGHFAPRLPQVVPVCVAVILLFYAFATQPVRAWKMAHPKTPHLQSALMTRENPWDHRSAANRRILTFGFYNEANLYDPHIIMLRNPAQLALLCKQADREKRPLYGNFGHLDIVKTDYPRALALLKDRRLFSVAATVGGADRRWDRYVFVYAPGSASNYDFGTVLTAEELAYVEANVMKRPEAVFTKKKNH